MGAVHILPGTTFSNIKLKENYDAQGRAIFTLRELEACPPARRGPHPPRFGGTRRMRAARSHPAWEGSVTPPQAAQTAN
jgi:hypothetical protein